jgi:hypothetical protein
MRRFRALRILRIALCILLSSTAAMCAAKVHVISFGKSMSAQWIPDGNGKPTILKVRPLLVDARLREYVLGPTHEVTERLFVFRRAFRVNDSLQEDPAPHWQWQRGGWMVADRTTGRISPVNLPDFDAFYSAANWYRDYVAYCGVSDDGKVYAIVAQIGRRKPVLKKLLSNSPLPEEAGPDSACPPPVWQLTPVRVSFEPVAAAKEVFAIRGHVVDLVSDIEEDEGAK